MDQEEILQCTGQSPRLHILELLRDGQLRPPVAGTVVTVRVWVCEPTPQDLEHSAQGAQAETTQLMAQALVLHCLVWERAEQPRPP